MARRMKSGMLVAGLALAACTPVGCALISGVGDLSVVGNGALDGTAPPLVPPLLPPPLPPRGDGAAGPDPQFPPDGGAMMPPPDGGVDAGPTCAAPATLDGSFVPCVKGSAIALSYAGCVDYCRSLGRCCAENCTPFSTDRSVTAAEFADSDEAHCLDPLTSPPTGNSASYKSCSNSAFTNGVWVKCCCR